MIKKVEEKDIAECVKVIRESFLTVANDLGFTVENAPGFTAFATTEDRLRYHYFVEQRPMYAYYEGDTIVGYFSLLMQENQECELNNLCVSPEYRHKGIGEAILEKSFELAKEMGCVKVNIGIVEENQVLREWYESFEFVHLGTHKSERFPFTCGFLEKKL